MTTQELKQYIDKVLGNSIRCLLPSYWWKRAFGAVVDNMVNPKEVKTINGESILGEGDLRVGVKSVESVEALEKLDAEVADIASVGYESLNLVSVGSAGLESADDIVSDWNKLTRIVKVEQGVPYSNGSEYVLIWLHGKSEFGEDLIQLVCESGEFLLGHYSNITGKEKIFTFDSLNTFLQENEYRLIGYRTQVSVKDTDNTFKLYTKSSTADAYVKSDSWDKLAKEYIASSEEELNTLSVENGTIAKVARELKQINRANCHTVIKFSDIPANWDKFTRVDKVEHIGGNTSNSCGILLAHYDGHAYVVLRINFVGHMTYVASVYVDSTLTNEVSITKAEVDVKLKEYDFRYIGPTFTSGEPYIDSTFILYEKDISVDAYIKGETWTRLLKEGDVTGGGADVTIDSELSDTSENAVQNKVVTSAIESIALELGEMVGDINTSKADNTRVDLISERLDDLESEMVTDADLDRAIASAITNTLNTEV